MSYTEHYCAVSEAREKMPCMEQCKECYDYEHEGEEPMSSPGREPDYRQEQESMEAEQMIYRLSLCRKVAKHDEQTAGEIAQEFGIKDHWRTHETHAKNHRG